MKTKHSSTFLEIITKAINSKQVFRGIREVTHKRPLLIFWASPQGEIIDAKGPHHSNPPNGNRSILADPQHQGYLRGRSAIFGDKLYVVIYGRGPNGELSDYQLQLLRRSLRKLLDAITAKNKSVAPNDINNAILIDDYGREIQLQGVLNNGL